MLKIQKSKFKFIYVEITNNCNLNCYFCPSSKQNNSSFISPKQFEHVIKQVQKYTNTIYLHILGEPLLHKDLPLLLSICEKYNLDVRLTTNGTLVCNYDFSCLKLKKINISLQSLINFDEDYLETYFNNIKIMLNQVQEKLECGKLGIDFRIWNDKNNDEVKKLNSQIKTYLNEVLEINKYKNVRLSEEEEFSWPDELDPKHKFNKCLGGKTHIGILVNGDVVMCCLDYKGKTKLGNIYEESLDNIIDGDIYKCAMLNNTKGNTIFPICESCQYRNRFK